MSASKPVSARPLPSALSHLGPAAVLAAAPLIRDGRVWDLAVDLDPALLPPTDPRVARPVRRVDVMTPAAYREAFASGDSGFHLDAVSGSIHQGTHIDGLAHIVHEGRIFGGTTEAAARSEAGWTVQGAETIPPIVGRAVLLDLVAARQGRHLEGSHEIVPHELAAAIGTQRVEMRDGDVVLVRTVHVELLAERGIHLLEWLDLEALATSGRAEFFFVAAPLKISGATGAWLRPVAIT